MTPPAEAVPEPAEIDALLRAGRRSEALAGARRRCVALPGDPRALAAVAAAGAGDRRAGGAAAICRRTVCLAPGADWVHRNLGRALEAADAAASLRALRRALVLAPGEGRALGLLLDRCRDLDADRLLGALTAVRPAEAGPPFRRGMLRVRADRAVAGVPPLLEALARNREAPSLTPQEAEATAFYALSGLLRRRDVTSARGLLADRSLAGHKAVATFFAGLLDLADGRLEQGFGRIGPLAGATSFDIVDLIARFTPDRIADAVAPGAAAGWPDGLDWRVRGPAPRGRPVLLVSADPAYARALLPALIETVPPPFAVHFHLLLPPDAAADVGPVLDLLRSTGGSATAETLATGNRTALITRRYEILPAVMAHYRAAVAVADADLVFGAGAGKRLAAVPGSVRLAFRDWLLPWIAYDANFVWVADDAVGRRFAAALSRLLRAIDADSAPWFADQVALYAILRHFGRDGAVAPDNLLDHLAVGMSGREDLVKLTAGPLAAKTAHLDQLRRQGFFAR